MIRIVGIGLSITSITIDALLALLSCDEIYLDTYTSTWFPDVEVLASILRSLGKRVELCSRNMLEGSGVKHLVARARERDVCIAVPGDPMFATTHSAIASDAWRLGVEVEVVTSVSIMNAVYDHSCLQPYRFGKIVTVVAPKEGIFFEYPIYVLRENRSRGLHTVLLLEMDAEKRYFMNPREAIEILLEAQRRSGITVLDESTPIVILSAVGSPKQCIEVRSVRDVINGDYQCKHSPHTLVVPAPKLHPIEEECLEHLRTNPSHTLFKPSNVESSTVRIIEALHRLTEHALKILVDQAERRDEQR